MELEVSDNLISIGIHSNIQNFRQFFPDIRIVSLREIQTVLRQGTYEENFQRKIFNICMLQSETFLKIKKRMHDRICNVLKILY